MGTVVDLLNGIECISSSDFSLFFANIIQEITMDVPSNTIDFLLFLRRLALATQIFGDQNHFSDGKLPD